MRLKNQLLLLLSIITFFSCQQEEIINQELQNTLNSEILLPPIPDENVFAKYNSNNSGRTWNNGIYIEDWMSKATPITTGIRYLSGFGFPWYYKDARTSNVNNPGLNNQTMILEDGGVGAMWFTFSDPGGYSFNYRKLGEGQAAPPEVNVYLYYEDEWHLHETIVINGNVGTWKYRADEPFDVMDYHGDAAIGFIANGNGAQIEIDNVELDH